MPPAIDPAASTVLITGGTGGIGRAFAGLYEEAGAKVYVTTRQNISVPSPEGIQAITSDISSKVDRVALAETVRQRVTALNVLVLNAGIQRQVPISQSATFNRSDDVADSWAQSQLEIDTLLSGPIHLLNLLLPVMLAHGRPSQIVIVTSGLGIVPSPRTPVYSACKAAIRSYVQSLRHAVEGTNIVVTELIPPRVNTGLGGIEAGVGLKDYTDSTFPRVIALHDEVGYGTTEEAEMLELRQMQRRIFDTRVKGMGVKTLGEHLNAK